MRTHAGAHGAASLEGFGESTASWGSPACGSPGQAPPSRLPWILHASHASLNRRLDPGPIPWEMIGSRRRLRLADVLRLRERYFQRSSADLGELSALGQERQGEALSALRPVVFPVVKP